MSADSSKRPIKSGNAGQVILPQPVSDPSIIDSVAGFINEVVPQAYQSVLSGGEVNKESVIWAKFLTCDYNNPENFLNETECQSDSVPPLLLALAYGTGLQIWGVSGGGECRELLWWPHGSVRAVELLSSPPPGVRDSFGTRRPLAAIVDSASPGPQYHALNFLSLRTNDVVKNIKFKSPICDVVSNQRSVVVTLPEKIAVFDASTLEDRLTVTTCYPSPGLSPNPIALGPRWLAYCDKKLTTWQRSSGGCEDDGLQSYTATVIHAAKSLGKGLRELGGSLTGSSPQSSSTPSSQPGIVTIIDIENGTGTSGNRSNRIGEEAAEAGCSIVAHFVGHSGAIVAMTFDPSGLLLVIGDRHGHRFNVFRIHPHPSGPSLAAVHHLYILHRGDTTARVQDMCVSWDSRWVAVSSLRGTTHVFPIAPYGGPVAVRTHTTPHVVNRLSRFERSVGLTDGRGSPTSEVAAGGLTCPRLPPYPHPVTVAAVAQLRRGGSSETAPEPSPPSVLRVAARFASPRAFLPPRATPPRTPRTAVKPRVADSLFIVSSYGSLIQYDLEPRAISSIAKEKISFDTGIEVSVEAKGEWVLARGTGGPQLPIPPGHPLLIGVPSHSRPVHTVAVSSPQLHHPAKGADDQWLSQVEIITHTGPHRRLWMGPQFSFKSLDSGSPVDKEVVGEIDPLPARSNPVNMPRRPYLWIESGSGGSIDAPYMAEEDDNGHSDSRLREDLADAMMDTSLHAHGGVGAGINLVGSAVERRVTSFGAVVSVSGPVVLPNVPAVVQSAEPPPAEPVILPIEVLHTKLEVPSLQEEIISGNIEQTKVTDLSIKKDIQVVGKVQELEVTLEVPQTPEVRPVESVAQELPAAPAKDDTKEVPFKEPPALSSKKRNKKNRKAKPPDSSSIKKSTDISPGSSTEEASDDKISCKPSVTLPIEPVFSDEVVISTVPDSEELSVPHSDDYPPVHSNMASEPTLVGTDEGNEVSIDKTIVESCVIDEEIKVQYESGSDVLLSKSVSENVSSSEVKESSPSSDYNASSGSCSDALGNLAEGSSKVDKPSGKRSKKKKAKQVPFEEFEKKVVERLPAPEPSSASILDVSEIPMQAEVTFSESEVVLSPPEIQVEPTEHIEPENLIMETSVTNIITKPLPVKSKGKKKKRSGPFEVKTENLTSTSVLEKLAPVPHPQEIPEQPFQTLSEAENDLSLKKGDSVVDVSSETAGVIAVDVEVPSSEILTSEDFTTDFSTAESNKQEESDTITKVLKAEKSSGSSPPLSPDDVDSAPQERRRRKTQSPSSNIKRKPKSKSPALAPVELTSESSESEAGQQKMIKSRSSSLADRRRKVESPTPSEGGRRRSKAKSPSAVETVSESSEVESSRRHVLSESSDLGWKQVSSSGKAEGKRRKGKSHRVEVSESSDADLSSCVPKIKSDKQPNLEIENASSENVSKGKMKAKPSSSKLKSVDNNLVKSSSLSELVPSAEETNIEIESGVTQPTDLPDRVEGVLTSQDSSEKTFVAKVAVDEIPVEDIQCVSESRSTPPPAETSKILTEPIQVENPWFKKSKPFLTSEKTQDVSCEDEFADQKCDSTIAIAGGKDADRDTDIPSDTFGKLTETASEDAGVDPCIKETEKDTLRDNHSRESLEASNLDAWSNDGWQSTPILEEKPEETAPIVPEIAPVVFEWSDVELDAPVILPEGVSDADYDTCSEKKSDSSMELYFALKPPDDRDSIYESCNDEEECATTASASDPPADPPATAPAKKTKKQKKKKR